MLLTPGDTGELLTLGRAVPRALLRLFFQTNAHEPQQWRGRPHNFGIEQHVYDANAL